MPPRRRKGKKKKRGAKAAVPVCPVVPERPSGPCAACGTVTTNQCACDTVFLCGRVCQKANWPTHKLVCPARPARGRKKKGKGK